MRKIILILTIFLLVPGILLAKFGESNHQPNILVQTQGKYQYRYNVKQVERQTDEGTTTVWTYDYVEVDPPVTKAKVKDALNKARSENTGIDEVESEMTVAQEKLSDVAGMSYSQIDTYIENNVTNLDEAKAYLKKLSKAVLAIVKQLDL